MRIVHLLMAIAIVTGVVKDVFFGTANNGLMVVVYGCCIAAILRLALVAANSDLKRSKRRDRADDQ